MSKRDLTYFHAFPNRTLCSVLEDMRKCQQTANYSPLSGLIEEAQVLGNRMESALSDKSDIRKWSKQRHDLKVEIKKLIEEYKKAAKKAGKKLED